MRFKSVDMDSPTERMPIACVHCAKAKAKCDKKVREGVAQLHLDSFVCFNSGFLDQELHRVA